MGRLQAVPSNPASHRIVKMKTSPAKLTGFRSPAPEPADKYIDMTPTWQGLMPALIAAAANGSQAAIDELMRLARTVDQQNERSKANLAAYKEVGIKNRGAK